MKIVLDTNVIIAAFAARGLCSDIFRFALESCVVIGSQQLLKECEQTFIKKLKVPKEKIENITSYIESQLEIVDPVLVDTDVCRDQDDLHVLGIALVSKAKFIVTGDKDLLVLKNFKSTKIFTPRQFWTYVQSLKGL